MPGYPLTLKKEIIIESQNIPLQEIMNIALHELTEFKSLSNIEGTTIKIIRSDGFSSGSTLRNFNKGEIKFIEEGNSIRIKGRFVLIEHFILIIIDCFLAALILSGDIGIYKSLSIIALIFVVSFVFFYLFPYMAFDTYFDILTKRIKEKQ